MGNLHGVKVYDNVMVGLLFCCSLVIIGVANVSIAFVGLCCWFGWDSVGSGWERYQEGEGPEEGNRGEWGGGGAGMGFFHCDFCIVNGRANAG